MLGAFQGFLTWNELCWSHRVWISDCNTENWSHGWTFVRSSTRKKCVPTWQPLNWMPAKRKHLGNFWRWYLVNWVDLVVFWGQWCRLAVMLVDGIKLRSFVKEPISGGFGAVACSQRSLEEWSPLLCHCVMDVNQCCTGNCPFEKNDKMRLQMGEFANISCNTPPPKKEDFIRLEVLERVSKHPSQRCDEARLFN